MDKSHRWLRELVVSLQSSQLKIAPLNNTASKEKEDTSTIATIAEVWYILFLCVANEIYFGYYN